MMSRALVLFIGCCLTLGSCTQRQICPAFQSAYIYDKDELRKKFSYFQADTTPKILTASKNRYLVAEPTPYRKKVRSLRTIEMKPVPVNVPDSIANGDSVSVADLDRAARSVMDSTFIQDVPAGQQAAPVEDSVYVITKDREVRMLKYNGADSLEYDPVAEKYVAQKPEYYVEDVRLNIEQDNYMWYLRDYLVLPDVRLAQQQQSSEGREAGKRKKGRKDKQERQGLKGFFKNLFKKKPKADSTQAAPPPPAEEFDFIDSDTLTQIDAPAPPPQTRKGILASRRTKPVAEQPRKGEALKEEDEEPAEGF